MVFGGKWRIVSKDNDDTIGDFVPFFTEACL